jgi:hypothetical protein
MNAPTPQLPLLGEPITAPELDRPQATDQTTTTSTDQTRANNAASRSSGARGPEVSPSVFARPNADRDSMPNVTNVEAHTLGQAALAVLEAPPAETRTLTVLRPEQDDCEFDWSDDNVVVLREQRLTAVYRNPHGDLVIRQERSWNEDEDPFLVIAANNVQTLIDKLCDLEGIPSAP